MRHHATLGIIAQAIALTLLALLCITCLYAARDVIIILFLAVLFAIFLNRTGSLVSAKFGWPYQAGIATSVALILLATVGSVILFGSRAKDQVEFAAQHVDEARSELRRLAEKSPAIADLLDDTPMLREWIDSLLPARESDSADRSQGLEADLPLPKSMDETRRRLSQATNTSYSPTQPSGRIHHPSLPDDQASLAGFGGFASTTATSTGDGRLPASNDAGPAAQADKSDDASQPTAASGKETGQPLQSVLSSFFTVLGKILKSTFGLLVSSLIIFFVGIFLSLTPQQARDGLATLVQPSWRCELCRILDLLGDKLWSWLLGRFASMVLTGLGVGVALWLLGVPMAGMLGLLTGLLTFIPNIGAAISLGLAMFVALPDGLTTVGWVVVAFVGFQLVESYLLTPSIQQYQVDVRPYLLISAQAVLGALLGFLGAMIASPLLVAVLVLHREVYRKQVLGEAV